MHWQDTTEKKVFDYINQHKMLMPGDTVVAGISGGADSVCLLLMLVEWKKRFRLDVHVVHVNHGIRKEAARDAFYVEELCKRYQLPFTLVEADVHNLARQNKCSEEEMGRTVRYDAFMKEAERINGVIDLKRPQNGRNVKIAVAHNSNDQAETILFHLFRGSGLTGLCGIWPVRDRIIRPLLNLERQEIEDYLMRRGVDWCRDITNEGDSYIRNRIRHHILPYAEQEIVQGSIAHITQSASMLQETEDFLKRLTQDAYDKLVRKTDAGQESFIYRLFCDEFQQIDQVIRKRLIYRLLSELSPGGKDVTYTHVQYVAELFKREGNRSVCLPYHMIAVRQYNEVLLQKVNDAKQNSWSFVLDLQEILQKEATIWLPSGESLHFRVLFGENYKDIPQNEYTKWFDYDKIKKCLTIRTRKSGDFLSIRGALTQEQHKAVKDYMVTQKIPRQERDHIPVIAEDNHILWLVGYRISEYYKISKNTKRVLQVQLREDCLSGSCLSSEMEENNGGTC